MKFWSYAKDSRSDKETIFNLYSNGLLNITLNLTIRNKEFENYKSTASVFWYSFHENFNANPNGSNGKNQILLIIAENFTYKKLMENL